MRRTIWSLAVLTLAAGPLAAQRPTPQGPPGRFGEHAQQLQQMQQMQRQMDQLMVRIRATNTWMQQDQARMQFREMGQQLEQTGERLRLMFREMDRLQADPAITRDQARAQDRARLQTHLQQMQRDLDQAHVALCQLSGRTGCEGP